MRVLRFLGWLSVVIMLAICVAIFMGSRLPAEHRASVTDTVAAPQLKVWGLMTNLEALPRWRTGLKAVQLLPSVGGATCWAEVQNEMTMPLCAEIREAPVKQVVRITDPKLPFGGTWTYLLEPAGENATKVTIIEDGTIGPAMWRFVNHYAMHEDGQIRLYMADLKRAAGEAN
jgi:Polyketide cyclase / dehydrase and lipid transport